MQKSERAAQARRELDRKFQAAELQPIEVPPRSGWIRAIRTALGMSQMTLAERLEVSGPAITRLEQVEPEGRVTLATMAKVAAAMDCHLVYALVPNSTIDDTVRAQARREAATALGYVARTMALEAQEIDADRQAEAVERYAQRLVETGQLWRDPRGTGH